MANKFITFTSANEIDKEGKQGIEIFVIPTAITHFHKAEGNFTHIHFLGGQTVLVTQTVEEVKELIDPSPTGEYHFV